jgi:glycogen debranching enzyme
MKQCCDCLKSELTRLNQQKEAEIADHINKAVDNYVANAKYRFVDHHGPRIPAVTKDQPLMFE